MSDDNDNTSHAGRISVRIFDRVYTLRSAGGNQEHVRRVARLVDERMQQVSEMLTTSDVAKVAVLAALNIAGELEELRERREREARAAETPAPAAAPPPAPAEPDRAERRSWFEEIFDDEFAQKRNNDERLSSLVSSKLQRHRPPAAADTERPDPDEEG